MQTSITAKKRTGGLTAYLKSSVNNLKALTAKVA